MHPILIAGAALVALPVILHLIMKQEPKRLLFPAVRFLRQKKRINQHKMRLRHLLLLLMRMLLIALFCLALFQPRLPSAGLNLGLSGEQPVAAVFVLDTSPSMGYTADGKTRLDEARRRALELLDDLPADSKVAVLDPVEAVGNWEVSVGDARRKIEAMREPHGAAPPITTALQTAYQLLKTVDQETDSSEPLPRLVAVFSDRAAASWQADRTEDLKRALAEVPPPSVAHLFVDVGTDGPANVSITAVEARPPVVPVGQPVTIAVTAQAAGPDVTAVVRCKLDNAGTPERKELPLSAGTPKAIGFAFHDLKPGLHQVEVALETPDKLTADDVRYVTFRVGESKAILTVADDPAGAAFWQLAHQAKGEFRCDVVKPGEVTDLGGYDAVCLLCVSDPTQRLPGGATLWQKVADFVKRGGGLLVIPGSPEQITLSAYDPANEATAGLLPAKFNKVIDAATQLAEPRNRGVEWALGDDATLRHPLLAPFQEWKRQGNVDFLRNPRRAYKYWEVVDAAPGSVVVRYDDYADPAKRSPAILEKLIGGGKVVVLTTRMDTPWPPDQERPQDPGWNNYWKTSESSWGTVFPNLLARYLVGGSAEPLFNFSTGQRVPVPLPKGDIAKGKKLILEGPGVTGRDAFPEVAAGQPVLVLPPGRTRTAGNYVLRTEDRSWQEGFSLNPPADEFNLTKVPKEPIEELFGPNSVVGVERDLRLRDVLESRYDPELKLLPWLLLAVLVLFAVEGFVANRFYRLRR
ncbi:MAG TPA: BatA domain-containing protein [Fimbriiglobus sp.]|nr:BatA domain-containing protein [Fimbriiglobus sp.]